MLLARFAICRPVTTLMLIISVVVLGLVALSKGTGLGILVAATLYGFGKTFFWPTMLGVVGERFPRGGAITMGAVGATGALSAGLLGTPGIGTRALGRRQHGS